MSEDTPAPDGPAKPHDVDGLPAGTVERDEHDTAFWEWQIDAMIRLMLKKGVLLDFAELRDGIEMLTPEDYERLSYYERWAASAARAVTNKGFVTQDELDRRVEALRARLEGESGERE